VSDEALMDTTSSMEKTFSERWHRNMLRTITEAQQRVLLGDVPRSGFENLLDGLLELTGSEYGFVGELMRMPDGAPYLKTYAISDIAWNESTRKLYDDYAESGLEFHNIDTLFGRVMVTGEVLIANDPATHDAAGGLPEGHPPLNAFLGLPLHINDEMVGMIGLSNREGGYDERLVSSLEPILTASGYLIASVRERRERVAAQTEATRGELLRHSVVETALDCVIAMDHEGKIIEFNPAAEQTFGWRRDDVIGRCLADVIVPEKLRQAHSDGMARYLASGEGPVLGKRIEVTAVRRDGTEFPIELAVTVAELDEHPVFTAYLRDITKRRRAEDELKRAHEAAEAASKAKSVFVATVSHEIRTPINAILGALGLLQESALNPSDRQYLDTAHRSAQTLLGLVSDVLDMSRIDAEQPSLEDEPVSPSELCDSVLELLAERSASNGNRLAGVVHEGVADKVWIDGSKVRQVLLNLVGNAVKFTRDGTIRLDCEDSGDTLNFTVVDTGIGIAEEDLPQVFSEFTQFGDARERGGAGLGLAISHRLVNLMGGTIEARSTLGSGSEFRVSIPFSRSERSPGRRLQGKRGLLTGGCAFTAKAVADQCQAWGATVQWLPDPDQARAMIEEGAECHFALILLERLPGNAAMAACRSLTEALHRSGTPVAVIGPDGSDCAECLGSKMDAEISLTHPVLSEGLADALAALLGDAASPTATWTHRMPQTHHPSQRVRVLLADDSQANRLVMSEMLRRSGFDVDTVANGSEAVEAVRSLPYDIVFMDIEMPEMDGLEATRRIRALDGGRSTTPIVALTANVLPDSRERFLAAGMNDYVSKPANRDQLSETIGLWVQRPPQPSSSDVDDAGEPPWLDGEALTTLGEDTDPTLVPKMVAVFLEELLTRAAAMTAGLEDGDTERLGREAHALKSSAATYGAVRISEHAARIDEACKRHEDAVAREHARQLVAAVEPTVDALKAHPLASE
jgi:PAS domain S-box-containing protein